MTPDEPFIHVRQPSGWPQIDGCPRFFRGHRLAAGSGGVTDGIFAEWEWGGTQLTVRTDRYGAAPLFYWADQTQVCVSPSLLVVLQRGAPTAFDWPGLAAFLRLGYFLGDDTPFAAVRAVPSGGLVWTAGTLTLTGARPRTAPTPVKRSEAIDGFIDLCRQSIRRRPPDTDSPVMPLSSGRDSRHILFELVAAGIRPRCVTVPRFPPRPAEDERIAPLVADAAGVPHSLLHQNPSRCDAEVRKNWQTHLCADEHAWFLAVAAQIAPGTTTMYDGLGGALSVPNRYHSFAALADIEHGRTRPLADRLIADYGVQSESFLRQVLQPAAYAQLSRELAVSRLATELDTHRDAPDPIKSFNFWNRNRRELALWPYAILRGVPTVYTPYLDRDLFDFLMGLPPTVMSPTLTDGKAFHTEAIHRAFPQYASVPFEDKRAPTIDVRAHNVRLAGEAGRYLLRQCHVATRLVNRAYVVPRALYSVARPAFGEQRPWLALTTLYLMQLELAASGSRVGRTSDEPARTAA